MEEDRAQEPRPEQEATEDFDRFEEQSTLQKVLPLVLGGIAILIIVVGGYLFLQSRLQKDNEVAVVTTPTVTVGETVPNDSQPLPQVDVETEDKQEPTPAVETKVGTATPKGGVSTAKGGVETLPETGFPLIPALAASSLLGLLGLKLRKLTK